MKKRPNGVKGLVIGGIALVFNQAVLNIPWLHNLLPYHLMDIPTIGLILVSIAYMAKSVMYEP